MPIAPLNDPARLDYTGDSQYHKIHFYEKIDGNGPISIELWPGED